MTDSPQNDPAQSAPVSASAIVAKMICEGLGFEWDDISPAAGHASIDLDQQTLLRTASSILKALHAEPQAAKEPVAWRYRHGANRWEYSAEKPDGPSIHLFEVQPLYADAPQPARPWRMAEQYFRYADFEIETKPNNCGAVDCPHRDGNHGYVMTIKLGFKTRRVFFDPAGRITHVLNLNAPQVQGAGVMTPPQAPLTGQMKS